MALKNKIRLLGVSLMIFGMYYELYQRANSNYQSPEQRFQLYKNEILSLKLPLQYELKSSDKKVNLSGYLSESDLSCLKAVKRYEYRWAMSPSNYFSLDIWSDEIKIQMDAGFDKKAVLARPFISSIDGKGKTRFLRGIMFQCTPHLLGVDKYFTL
jgi:hypothetical protein